MMALDMYKSVARCVYAWLPSRMLGGWLVFGDTHHNFFDSFFMIITSQSVGLIMAPQVVVPKTNLCNETAASGLGT